MEKGLLENLYHVAIAVKDLSAVEEVYKTALGLRVEHREVVEDQGVNTSMLVPKDGGTAIELLEPLDENSPISKFLDKRGEGIHHICFKVDDIEAVLERLKKQGVRLIDETPRPGAYNSRVAFIHPKAMNGVLVELSEVNNND
ncbi:MAG: methylmalonyl-CoA epimerase [Deltaproteobacteria bacterium]|nr:methylmalonyl-CoA epimerase [Deltaproteobacteria bacterium]MCK5710567.1 methylmalonyl-CoA epimerase [Deltaproteobacteria bacterium]